MPKHRRWLCAPPTSERICLSAMEWGLQTQWGDAAVQLMQWEGGHCGPSLQMRSNLSVLPTLGSRCLAYATPLPGPIHLCPCSMFVYFALAISSLLFQVRTLAAPTFVGVACRPSSSPCWCGLN